MFNLFVTYNSRDSGLVAQENGQNEQAAETPASLYTCNTCKGIFAVMRLQKVTTELTRTTWDSIELFERGCTRANSTLCNQWYYY